MQRTNAAFNLKQASCLWEHAKEKIRYRKAYKVRCYTIMQIMYKIHPDFRRADFREGWRLANSHGGRLNWDLWDGWDD